MCGPLIVVITDFSRHFSLFNAFVRWFQREIWRIAAPVLAGRIQSKMTYIALCANASGGGRLQLFCYKHESGVRSLFPGYVTAV